MTQFRFRLPRLPRHLDTLVQVPFTNLSLHIYWDDTRSGWWVMRNSCGGEAVLGRMVVVWGFDAPAARNVTASLSGDVWAVA